ncbi:hypothetical protein [Proteus hauseri]|uniref:hypothetical protein n=1 Tax=Proteus hauseri TaxID=183417 RepID=UPI0032DA57D6
MTKKTSYIALFIGLIFLFFFIFNYYLNTRPLASWQFYGKNGEYVTGYYYPPDSDSATDEIISIPEVPTSDGLRLTEWNGCHLELKMDNKRLSVDYFNDNLIQSSLESNIYPYTSLIELYFYQPNDMHWWVTRQNDGTYQGWIWDNIANQLIPVHYNEDKISLIEGTTYRLMEKGNWLFQHWSEGKVVEEGLLDDLPAKDEIIPDVDKERAIEAKIQMQRVANELAAPLNLPFDLILWDKVPCNN